MVLKQLDIHVPKKKNLGTDLISLSNMNSKCVTHLNVKVRTVKFLEVHIRENSDDLGLS